MNKLKTGATYLGVLFIVAGITYGTISLVSVQLQEYRDVRNWQRSFQEYSLLDNLNREIEFFLRENLEIQERQWSPLGRLYYRIEIQHREEEKAHFLITVTHQEPLSAETGLVMELKYERSDGQWFPVQKHMERVHL